MLASTYPRWRGDSVPAFVHSYAVELRRQGWDVRVLAPHHAGAARRERIDGIEVERFRYWWPATGESIAYGQYRGGALAAVKGAAYTLSQIVATLRLARRSEVVNAHWLIPQGFAAAVACGIARTPLVVTVHGSDVFTLTGSLASALKRWTLGHARSVVVNSSATLAACEALRSRAYEVLPMGSARTAAPTRSEEAPEASLALAFVGRLADGKGVDDAIRGLALARERGVRCSLRVVGDGPLRSSLEALVQESGLESHVTFDGWVDPSDVPGVLSAADALIAPSVRASSGAQEAFGLVFVEAALAGLPAIGTRCGGIPDVVVDGTTGVLVDEHSPAQIADAIVSLAGDPSSRRRMGLAARAHAEAEFTWDALAPRHSAVLRSAAGV